MTTQATVEALPYPQFLDRFKWRQGEHIGLIGPTGLGKTTLSLDLMSRRKFVCIIGTKPKDSTLTSFMKQNKYERVKEFPEVFDETRPRLVLWPNARSMESRGIQRASIGHGLQTMFKQGSWAINADEVSYISNELKLQPQLRLIWQQGRSIDISLVATTQRPVHVPLFIYDQSTHLFFFRDNDEANLKRIGGIGWLNSRVVREVVANLDMHYFLYLNTRTGEMIISKRDL